MRATFVLAASLGLLLATLPVAAHHSFAAQYDSEKPLMIRGTVTKVEWTNPHARFYVDVKDDRGGVANWNLELASPNVLTRNGWSRSSLKVGDVVSVDAVAARDGSRMANARAVVLSDGRRVFSGAPGQ
jgi:hypothetical protein